jgi:DNA-directed RNA polymerase specialized sigma subunit
MKIVTLSKSQNQVRWVTSPIFDHLTVLSDRENENLLRRFLKDPTLQDDVVLANLHLVRHTVGRYLFHWPETARFQDDMISVGVVALLEQILKTTPKTASYFRAKCVVHIKGDIEVFLNENQSSITASKTTNHRRVREGKPIASKQEESYVEN